mmetsp:Transcript_54180/g.118583  ORF Transcript_54180/g.118583 Transcript_54180/m.118583 type:complete len:242 (+) Transcript_54180:902-1627(+)
MELLLCHVSHLRSAVAVEDSKVDAQFLQRLVQNIAILQGLLQAGPAFTVDTKPQRLRRDVVALLLLLQGLRSRMNGQGLAIGPQHEHLKSTRLAVLRALLVAHLHTLLEVDGVAGSAAHDELPVHKEAFAHVTALLLPRRHDEAKALLRVPLVDSPLHPRILLLLRFFGWRLCHCWRRKRPCGRLGLLGSLAVHLKLHEFRLGDGFPHFFGLLHLLNKRIVVIIYPSEESVVALFRCVVHL